MWLDAASFCASELRRKTSAAPQARSFAGIDDLAQLSPLFLPGQLFAPAPRAPRPTPRLSCAAPPPHLSPALCLPKKKPAQGFSVRDRKKRVLACSGSARGEPPRVILLCSSFLLRMEGHAPLRLQIVPPALFFGNTGSIVCGCAACVRENAPPNNPCKARVAACAVIHDVARAHVEDFAGELEGFPDITTPALKASAPSMSEAAKIQGPIALFWQVDVGMRS